MATETEEVILEFKIDQADALTQLEKTKKSILGIKEEQRALNKAYKEGNITQDEYIKDTVRLESILKRQQGTYNDLSRAVTGQKNVIKELTKSNQDLTKQLKNTSQSFQDVAGEIRVAGVGVNDITAKFSSFLNPATAAVGIVGALGAAYARSTIGAKDLAFAQAQLSEATTLITNDFARLISSSEDGEGALTKLLNASLEFVGNTSFGIGLKAIGVDLTEIAKKSKELALIAEELEDLQRAELELRNTANDRLADNQELLTQIQSDQTKYNDKLDKTNEIITNIRRNEEEVKANLDLQLAAVTKKVKSDEANEALLDAQLAIKKEISALEKDSERKVQAIERLQQNITEQNQKQLEIEIKRLLLERQGEAAILKARNAPSTATSIGSLASPARKTTEEEAQRTKDIISGNADFELEVARNLNRGLAKMRKDRLKDETIAAGEEFRAREAADMAKLESAAMVAAGVARLYSDGSELQRLFALASIGIDTAQAIAALTAASEGNPANSVTFGGAGILQYASGIVRILANIAAAKEYLGGAAAGGGDFITTKPTLLMVGDNPGGRERVTVEPLSGKGQTTISPTSGMIRMAGGGSLIAGDGGLNVNTQTLETNQALITANAMKRMPTPVIGIEQFVREEARLTTKQSAVRINGRKR